LPELNDRWQKRHKRPVPPAISAARLHFDQIWAVDGSTLEALFRKLDGGYKSTDRAPLRIVIEEVQLQYDFVEIIRLGKGQSLAHKTSQPLA